MNRLSLVLVMLFAVGAQAQQKPIQWPPESLKITVKFADGSQVPLTLKHQNVDWWQPDPTQDGPANVKRLEPLAKGGDAGAAFGISQFLADCRSAPRDDAQLAAWIRVLREKRQLTWADGRTSDLPASSPLDQFEKGYRDRFRRCKGLTPADLASAEQWRRKAADNGHLWALVYLYQDRSAGLSPADLLNVARKTWELGDIAGLDRVSRALEDVNRVESVAYLVLADRLTAAIVEAANNGSTQFGADYASKRLAGALRELTPDERARATGMAKEILRKNPRCCHVN